MSFAEVLQSGTFTVLSEIDPPKGVNLDGFIDRALMLKGRVDAVAVTDSDHAVMRMSPIAPCHRLLAENLDPVMVISGRDRNRISLQADLLSAWELGVRTVLIKEGIDPDWGDQPMVKTSGDLDLESMIKCVAALNNGKDLAGEDLDGKTDFCFGCGIDPSDDININRQQADSIMALAEYGVQFLVLGPTYDRNIIEIYQPKAEEAGIKLITTLMLLKSVVMIRYLNNLSGVPAVPHEYLKQMLDAPVKAEAGIDIAVDYFNDVKDCCQGMLLHALGWGNHLTGFLDRIGR